MSRAAGHHRHAQRNADRRAPADSAATVRLTRRDCGSRAPGASRRPRTAPIRSRRRRRSRTPPMSEPTRGLLDTSVVVDHDVLDSAALPDQSAISAITLAELAGRFLHATSDSEERARRQDRLQWAAATWTPLPFDVDAARAVRARLRRLACGRPFESGTCRRFADRGNRRRQWARPLHPQSRRLRWAGWRLRVIKV